MNSPAFDTILIANRGEIACRVIRTARALGYRTVAVYSEADRHAPHVRMADLAVPIGPPAAAQSYLNIGNLIEAATNAGAGAIHPGYGFLSENAAFAEACATAGIIFIGPPVDAIKLMGNKRAAKIAMLKAGVPCVPGYEGEDQNPETLAVEAEKIGFPVMVKAAAGGGGRGMRLVDSADGLIDAINGARTEAENAFGSGELILEKAIVQPRHIEIQVFGDTHGNIVHLGERDCSVQRRHQKIIEESPSPAVDEKMRKAMGDAAVAAARACDYVGAGTVEFIGDQDGNYYFLEMNTRLQVEHPVTEMVTGQDLVAWQLDVAAGKPLPLSQEQVSLSGHAIEVRLYAEDPNENFMPQTGVMHRWRPAVGVDIRLDSGIAEGGEVSPHYDPMIAKFIAHGPERDTARRKLVAALDNTVALGVTTNQAYLRRVLTHAEFAAGRATTAFIAEHMSADNGPADDAWARWGLAALARLLATTLPQRAEWLGWSSGGPLPMLLHLESGDADAWVSLQRRRSDGPGVCFDVTLVEDAESVAEADAPETVKIEVIAWDGESITLRRDAGPRQSVWYCRRQTQVWVQDGSTTRQVTDVTHRPAQTEGAGTGVLPAPLDGAVIDVRVAVGDPVTAGQVLVVVEAMKMEHQIKADVDGVVAELHAQTGVQVKTGQLLARITPVDDEEGSE